MFSFVALLATNSNIVPWNPASSCDFFFVHLSTKQKIGSQFINHNHQKEH